MRKFFTVLFSLLLLGLFAALTGAVLIFYYFGAGLPDYKSLSKYQPPVITRLYSGNGRMFGEYAWEKRLYVPFNAIPKRLVHAFLSAEDKNFYHHSGIDIPSIIGAAVTNLSRVASSKRPVGASTITQQVAKNFLLSEIAHSVSYERKIKEAILAFRIENAFSKDHILELYLNEIYLGASSYGVAAAALNYFNKSLDELSVAEAAFLAALPKAPSRYSPDRDYDAAVGRRNYVIARMLEDGHITEEEAKAAKAESLKLIKRDPGDVVHASYFAEEVRRELLEKYGENALYQDGLVVRTTLDPQLQEMAERHLKEGLIAYDRKHGWRGASLHLPLSATDLSGKTVDPQTKRPLWQQKLIGADVPTGHRHWAKALVLEIASTQAKIGLESGNVGTIPLSELKWARRYMNENARGEEIAHPKQVMMPGDVILVEKLAGEKVGKDTYRLCQTPKVSGALVVMEPHTGRVLALQGGFDFDVSQYNRATQAKRQIGSTFKPFVYLAALEQGLSPSTIIYDAPFSISLGWGLGIWRPNNWDKKFMGALTLRRAFELSRNLATIRLTHEKVGMKTVVNLAKRFNIVEDMPNQLAMVLGAGETTLLRLTAGFAMIANGGKRVAPTLLDRVQDRNGKTLLVNKSRFCQDCDKYTAESDALPTIMDTAEQVTDPGSAYQILSFLQGVIERGTGRKLQELKRPIAGKTGTTNDYRDAWFVGFTPDLVVGVYIGFDTPQSLGVKHYGAVVALPVFHAFMKEALKDKPAIPFRVPKGVRLVRVNANTGRPTSSRDPDLIYEAFKEEQEVPMDSVQVGSQASGERNGSESGEEEGEIPSSNPHQGDSHKQSSDDRKSTDPKITGTGGLY